MSAPKKPRPAVDDEVKAKFRAALDAKKSHGGADVSDHSEHTKVDSRPRTRGQRDAADVPPQERRLTRPDHGGCRATPSVRRRGIRVSPHFRPIADFPPQRGTTRWEIRKKSGRGEGQAVGDPQEVAGPQGAEDSTRVSRVPTPKPVPPLGW